MRYLPVFLQVAERPCVVIGGGEVAARRVETLLRAGAIVTVISRELCRSLRALVEAGSVTYLARSYIRGDLNGCAVCYVALDEPETARAIALEAQELGVPINVSDSPALSSFIVPALVRRGDLQVAISTGGASPALARRLREELGDLIGPEYALLIDVLRAARIHLQSSPLTAEVRREILSKLAGPEFRECVLKRDFASADAFLSRHLGCRMAEMGIDKTRIASVLNSSDGMTRPS